MIVVRRIRLIALFALLLFALTAAAARRRSVGARDWIGATPEGWLASYAHPLSSIDGPSGSTADLQPLKAMIGDATVVGLGDPTHGTHEALTLKLRLIDFLAREMNFDVVALEAPYAILNRIDAWVQGGPGDPRAFLLELHEMAYIYWDYEEFVDVLEWMRAYNASRGDRPALRIAGVDVFDQLAAMNQVLDYLRAVDPAAAATAETLYACARANEYTTACRNTIAPIRTDMVTREAELISRSSVTAYTEALQYARVVELGRSISGRDFAMAENLLWLRDHRSTTGRVLYWAHNAHVQETSSLINGLPAGMELNRLVGDDYFSMAMLVGGGSFTWWPIVGPNQWSPTTVTFPALTDEYYESLFRRRPATALLIPMPDERPPWLPERGLWRWAGSIPHDQLSTSSRLPIHFDAVIYVDQTTAATPVAR